MVPLLIIEIECVLGGRGKCLLSKDDDEEGAGASPMPSSLSRQCLPCPALRLRCTARHL